MTTGRPAAFAIKAPPADPGAMRLPFTAMKTMYAGKTIAPGDILYLFGSEGSGGVGLYGRGVVASAEKVPLRPDLTRQTPRVTIAVDLTERAIGPLGRAELRAFDQWNDGRAETELNFKFYRQATDKIVGLSKTATTFLDGFFLRPSPRT